MIWFYFTLESISGAKTGSRLRVKSKLEGTKNWLEDLQSITLLHTHPSSTALCFPFLLIAVKQKNVGNNGEEEEMIFNLGKRTGWEHCIWKINLTGNFEWYSHLQRKQILIYLQSKWWEKMWIETSEKYGDKGKKRFVKLIATVALESFSLMFIWEMFHTMYHVFY